jgi:hypothetical protein
MTKWRMYIGTQWHTANMRKREGHERPSSVAMNCEGNFDIARSFWMSFFL